MPAAVGRTYNQLSPTVDRIDSNRHRGGSNLQIVCKLINMLRNAVVRNELKRLLSISRHDKL